METIKLIILAVITFSVTAQANTVQKVPRLKAVTVFNHPVVHQTPPLVVASSKSRTLVKRYYIARWGTERFEYGEFMFECQSHKCIPWKARTVLAMFKSCNGLSKDGEPNCTGQIASDNNSIAGSSQKKGREWYACDDYDQACRDRRNDVEFPDRHTPEDQQMPGNMPI